MTKFCIKTKSSFIGYTNHPRERQVYKSMDDLKNDNAVFVRAINQKAIEFDGREYSFDYKELGYVYKNDMKKIPAHENTNSEHHYHVLDNQDRFKIKVDQPESYTDYYYVGEYITNVNDVTYTSQPAPLYAIGQICLEFYEA